MKWLSFEATASVAYKEFLHIYRDRRVLLLVLLLPPLFTLLFGHAFETSELTDVPCMLINRDNTPRSQEFIDIISKNKTFRWRYGSAEIQNESDLLAYHVRATLVIPAGWNESLENGDPKPLLLYLDGGDINTADAVEGSVRQSLGDFQLKQRDRMIETLPDEVYELGKQLQVQVRKRFVSMMEMWSVDRKLLYNPKSRVIDYVVPGIIGLILQLLTVTLMACTIARERESGTLYQLMIAAKRLAFWSCVSRPAGVGAGLSAISSLFARARIADLGFLAHANPGDPVFGFLLTASLCALRSICATRTIASGRSLHLRIVSANTFLPRFSAGEHVWCRTAFLY
jgi:hypothetical protein